MLEYYLKPRLALGRKVHLRLVSFLSLLASYSGSLGGALRSNSKSGCYSGKLTNSLHVLVSNEAIGENGVQLPPEILRVIGHNVDNVPTTWR